MLRWIGFIVFVFASTLTFSQRCFDFHKKHCSPTVSKFSYQINDHSAAYKFNAGELRRIPFNLLDNKDYRITLCNDSIFNDILLFVIKDSKGTEIYNNSQHSFSLNLEFSSKKNQEVFFELTVPDNSDKTKDNYTAEGCIGILIEEMNTIKTGF
jgi:hypothetical protein